ncbi:hypothetical protein [Nocardiopsis baichengensis]|uniref:hypothetical protein n=1 Tax=Nocardiopsis baichengensis TaxID=280240 RepID=UPI00034A7D15|nr:hypothetical protein [Nocardiopsis baichengensis]
MAPSARVCPYCERRVALRKDGSRQRHFINDTYFWASYTLKECRGSDPRGAVPSGAAIARTRGRTMLCPGCDRWVKTSKSFRPLKHQDRNGRDCKGWSHNSRA